MKNYLLTFLLTIPVLLFLFHSCEKEPTKVMELCIENSTEDTILIKLYPKSEFIKFHDLYKPNDKETENYTGPYVNRIFDILTNSENSIFSSNNIEQNPVELMAVAFDSIQILLNEEQELISFSNSSTIGYHDNIFNSNSLWKYEIVHTEQLYQFNSKEFEIHKYSFVVSANK